MIGLVMCGGRGTRMKASQEKLLLKYRQPIIQHVMSALQQSNCFSKIMAATSNNAPRTRQFLSNFGIYTIDTQGKGYVQDLNYVLCKFDEPVFVASGDLPLLDADVIKKIVKLADTNDTWTAIIISKDFLDLHHLKAEHEVIYENKHYSYSGISVVNPMKLHGMKEVNESYLVLDDERIAFNINTEEDYNLLSTT